MRTFATILAASVLVAACTAAGRPSATPTPTVTTPTAATAQPATPAATAKARLIPATVTFDGVTCTYAGPTVVPLGSVLEWTFMTTAATAEERSSWELITFDVKPGTTFDEIVAWAAANVMEQASPFIFPAWSIDGFGMTVEQLVPGAPMRTIVEHYPVLVACGVGVGDVVNGEQVFPAMLIEVMKG